MAAPGATVFETAAVSESLGAPLAAIGDLGGDGNEELVVAQVGGKLGVARDQLEVYRLSQTDPPEMTSQVRVIPSSEDAGITQLLVGDVDPTTPGVEIVVVDEATARRSSARVEGPVRLRAERVASGGSLPCVADTRVAARGVGTWRLATCPGEAGERNDIVVGDACGRLGLPRASGTYAAMGPLCDLPERAACFGQSAGCR